MRAQWAIGAFCMLMVTAGCATTSYRQANTGVSAGQRNTTANLTDVVAPSPTDNPTSPGGSPLDLASTIQKYYRDHDEIILHSYSTGDGILVEWDFGDPTIASRYTWWDAKTVRQTDLPTNTDFTKVLSVTSTDVRLVTLGPNSIDPSLTFPYIIDDSRATNEGPFQMEKQPYYLLLSHRVEFGDVKTCVLTSLRPTMDGFQAAFGPLPTDKGDFYAASTGCPRMKTSYSAQDHLFTIRFLNTTLSGVAMGSASHLMNEFIASATARQSGSDTLLSLKLTSACTNYNGEVLHLYDPEFTPYAAFHFAGHADSYYPMVEEQPAQGQTP